MAHFYSESNRRVLAIEDESAVRRVYQRTLSALFDVSTADSLATARAALSDGGRFDALILDLSMAGESTTDFWTWLEESHPELPGRTLVISGQPDHPRYAAIVAGRGRWVMTKPVSPWDLRDRLHELLQSGRSAAKAEVSPC